MRALLRSLLSASLRRSAPSSASPIRPLTSSKPAPLAPPARHPLVRILDNSANAPSTPSAPLPNPITPSVPMSETPVEPSQLVDLVSQLKDGSYAILGYVGTYVDMVNSAPIPTLQNVFFVTSALSSGLVVALFNRFIYPAGVKAQTTAAEESLKIAGKKTDSEEAEKTAAQKTAAEEEDKKHPSPTMTIHNNWRLANGDIYIINAGSNNHIGRYMGSASTEGTGNRGSSVSLSIF